MLLLAISKNQYSEFRLILLDRITRSGEGYSVDMRYWVCATKTGPIFTPLVKKPNFR